MIIGTEYLHRLQLALEKLEEPDLKNVLKEDEMHKLQNGICTNMCSFLRVHCSRYWCAWYEDVETYQPKLFKIVVDVILNVHVGFSFHRDFLYFFQEQVICMVWVSHGFGNGSYYSKLYYTRLFSSLLLTNIHCIYFCTLQILDGGIILSIVFIRYNHYDITLTTDLYAISREYNINMGYMKDALLIAVICILVWSLIAKSMCFVGIYANRKSLFIIVRIFVYITRLFFI